MPQRRIPLSKSRIWKSNSVFMNLNSNS